MTLFFCVFCFVFTWSYSSTTARDVQVCVSYHPILSAESFINANWSFLDNEVNIVFEDRFGINNGVYNETSALGIPLRLNFDQTTVNVTVCRLNNTSSCHSVIAATTPIYNVTWRRVDDTTLEFTCELACRTPAITGCSIIGTSNRRERSFDNFSTIVSGTNEAISSRFVTVIVNNVDPTAEYSYTATPLAIADGISVSLNGIQDIIPAAIQGIPHASACISYNATGFPHLNLQWRDSEIDEVTNVKIYYSVNGGDKIHLTLPNLGSNSITDVQLPDVQYNDNISLQISLQNATTMTGRSDPLILRANPLYNVNWVFGDTFLAFICKLACRTSIISGCKVSLLQGTETTSVQSEQPVGTLEKLSGRDSSVVFINDISLNNSFSYRAIALTDDGATEFGEELVGNVSIEVLNTTSGTSTTMSSQTTVMPTASSTVTDMTTSSIIMLSSIVANTATPSVVTSSDHADDSVGVAVISGTIVGTLLIIIFLIIIIMMLVIIMVKKKSRRAFNTDGKCTTSSNFPNPQQHTHNTSAQSLHVQDHTGINTSSQLEVNPTSRLETVNALYIPTNVKSIDSLLQQIDDRSRSGVIGCDVIITPNPSYTVYPNSLQTKQESEYSYEYVQTGNDKATTSGGTHNEVNNLADNVSIDLNPSYSLPHGDQDIKLQDNPSYDKILL